VDLGSILRVWVPSLLGAWFLYWVALRAPVARDWMYWLGLPLCVVGLFGVMLARYTLGRSFSIRAKATALITTGIYSRIRNPIYLSGMIFLMGMILVIRRPDLSLLFVVIIPLQIVRARNEARVLEAKFGDDYRHYRERTWF
jgi:protein-S-isoprenylcysteine O-methyltransferase Ste14